MALMCPKCRRANPAVAAYCYFDGNILAADGSAGGPLNPATLPFPMPFVFPTGQTCNNFDQLALACLNNWTMARDLVKQGMFRGFLGGLGRTDLAMAADAAAKYPDQDRGLAELLTKLPANTLPPPVLTVQPAHLNLGVIPFGTDRPLELRLGNEGLGLVYGSVQGDDSGWLALLNVPVGTNRKLFQFVDETVIALMVRGQNLRAGNKPLEATLTVESNGGTQTVVVTAEVPVTPFPTGVLGGAVTPRKIAEKAKTSPKEAAALFESGAVQQWYKDNGWIYPVQGPAASGLAAVQQFFEALGLTPPPKVQLSVESLALAGAAGGSVRSLLEVTTPERRPIYAHAVSDQPWLKVEQPLIKGRSVSIPLAVPVVPHCPGETLRAKLTVTSNGNQRFEVPVSLGVTGSASGVAVLDMAAVLTASGRASLKQSRYEAEVVDVVEAVDVLEAVDVVEAVDAVEALELAEAVPVVAVAAGGVVAEPPRKKITQAPAPAATPAVPTAVRSFLLPILPVAFLTVALLLTCLTDVVGWVMTDKNKAKGGPGAPDNEPYVTVQFIDKEQSMNLGTGGAKPKDGVNAPEIKINMEPTMQFGLVTKDKNKRLTFDKEGYTNNVVLKVDNAELLFGQRPFKIEGKPEPQAGGWDGRWLGHWREMKAALGNDAAGRPRDGCRSVWAIDESKIAVTQTVEIVRGPDSNLLDTCLIQYHITNEDSRPHNVGLRFMLDTYIGDNDGVPFLIPGAKTELCNTMKNFNKPELVPPFIQACESDDLSNSGTVARIGLQLGDLEPPSAVTLGGYPNAQLRAQGPAYRGCNQEKTGWAVPVFSMKVRDDSAVAIYWNPKPLKAGESRDVGFTYGLGYVSGAAGGRLALTKFGSFKPRGSFSLTAYVSNPQANEQVTLTLPPGFEVMGSATQAVPSTGGVGRNSAVTWQVKASSQPGDYTLEVRSSTGASQTEPVQISTRPGIFGN